MKFRTNAAVSTGDGNLHTFGPPEDFPATMPANLRNIWPFRGYGHSAERSLIDSRQTGNKLIIKHDSSSVNLGKKDSNPRSRSKEAFLNVPAHQKEQVAESSFAV